jgi:triosephosphate isomerase
MKRRPILAANWKMHKTRAEAAAFVEAFLPRVETLTRDIDVVIAPAATALDRVGAALAGSAVALASQNVNAEPKGAYTGEISPGMLADIGCAYGIVGHSERRELYGEKDAGIAAKATALLEAGIRPIVCVGERLEDREANRTFEVVGSQLDGSLSGITAPQSSELVVAYEPVWAIGTGRTATPELAQEVHAFIRERLGKLLGTAAEQVRIQYGGSVKPENVAAIMAEPDIDGALVGGASLDPESFARVVDFEHQENEPS